MTLADILTVVTIAVMASGAVSGIFMYFDKRKNTKLTEKSTDGDYQLDLNQSVVIANQRAKDAEKDRREAELQHRRELAELREEFRIALEIQRSETEKQKVANDILAAQVAMLRLEISKIAYEISLVAQLGDEPVVEKVTIKRIVVIPDVTK
jgi:hypothetical protein